MATDDKPLTMEELDYWRDLAKSALNEDCPPGIDLPPQTVLHLIAAASLLIRRPIKTAPRDGTYVAGRDPIGHWYACRWKGDEVNGQWLDCLGYERMLVEFITIPGPTPLPAAVGPDQVKADSLKASGNRMVDCVEAMAGIAEPKKLVKAVDAVIAVMEKFSARIQFSEVYEAIDALRAARGPKGVGK